MLSGAPLSIGLTMTRRYLKDNCDHLTLAQVRRLLKANGLGKGCEYSVEALRTRYNELGSAQASKVVQSWQCEIGRGNGAPGTNTHGDKIRHFMVLYNLKPKDCARMFRVTGAAVRYWLTGKRSVPGLVLAVIDLINTNKNAAKYFLK